MFISKVMRELFFFLLLTILSLIDFFPAIRLHFRSYNKTNKKV